MIWQAPYVTRRHRGGAPVRRVADPDLIRRTIPSTGETVPVIGLSFSDHAGCADQVTLREVLKTFAANGGRLFDATHASNPAAEQFHATAARELGLQNKVFWSLRGAPTGPAAANVPTDAAAANAYVQMLMARHDVPAIDLIMVSPSLRPDGRVRRCPAACRAVKPNPWARAYGFGDVVTHPAGDLEP